MQFYVHVSLLVGQSCHNFQIHEEIHGLLNLRASVTVCSLYKNMYKNWFNRDGSTWQERALILKSNEAEVQSLDSTFTD